MKICYFTVWLLEGRRNPSSAHSSALGPFSRVLSFNAGSSTPNDQTITCQWLTVYRNDVRPASRAPLDGLSKYRKMDAGVVPISFFQCFPAGYIESCSFSKYSQCIHAFVT